MKHATLQKLTFFVFFAGLAFNCHVIQAQTVLPYNAQYQTYPAQQQTYPAQQPAYPAQQQTYPAQQQAYPAQQQAYPTQQQTYPTQQQTYPAQQQTYPAQQQTYQQQTYSAQQQTYPVQQQTYPTQYQGSSPQMAVMPPGYRPATGQPIARQVFPQMPTVNPQQMKQIVGGASLLVVGAAARNRLRNGGQPGNGGSIIGGALKNQNLKQFGMQNQFNKFRDGARKGIGNTFKGLIGN